MTQKPEPPGSVEEYLAGFPDEVRAFLVEVLDAVRRAMPGATETIRYGMPALMVHGRHGLHVAGWKSHVGLYPVPRFEDDPELEAAVEPYRAHKDTVRLRYRDPVPTELVERIATAVAARR